MSTIAEVLSQARAVLTDSDSAALDAELLLAHCLDVSRSYLYTWPERVVDALVLEQFQSMLARRGNGEPIAYLLGVREFWSLPLRVTADTLIPRPDTETLVKQALAVLEAGTGPARVLDLGTGSGAIALAIASDCDNATVIGVDRAEKAIAVAAQNARALGLSNVRFLCSDWFASLGGRRFDLIVANPPYVAAGDPLLEEGDVGHEPRSALVSGPDGLDDLRHIIAGAPAYLSAGGSLWVEHGHEQGAAVRNLFVARGCYEMPVTLPDLAGRDRITGARLASN